MNSRDGIATYRTMKGCNGVAAQETINYDGKD